MVGDKRPVAMLDANGNLEVKAETYPKITVKANDVNRHAILQVNGEGAASLSTRDISSGNGAYIMLLPEGTDINSILRLDVVVDGKWEGYPIYHAGNLAALRDALKAIW